jgi:hypothetical protein
MSFAFTILTCFVFVNFILGLTEYYLKKQSKDV